MERKEDIPIVRVDPPMIDEKESRPYKRYTEHASREGYTSAMEQKEFRDGVRDNPSVDQATQYAIALEYRALHERLKEEGFYDCRYSEYGKELVRYLLLFSAFVYLLRSGWYLTSACFLGMFWVCSFRRG